MLSDFLELDEWSALPSLIFFGKQRCHDRLRSVDCKPEEFLAGSSCTIWYSSRHILAIVMGFNGEAAAAISIIGGADGPTSIFLAGTGTDRS